jgi:hypothetical protein
MRPARHVNLVRFEHRRTTWVESSPIDVRPGSVTPAAERRRVRWPSWWRDQHPRSASDCSERAHGCFPQCRLPKPGPQPAPVPRTAMFGFPDPCVIMFRIIGRTPSGRGRLVQGHAMRYALSAACRISPADRAAGRRMIHPCDIASQTISGFRTERWRTPAAEVGQQFTSGHPWLPPTSSFVGDVVPLRSIVRGSEKGFLLMHREPIDRPGRDRRSFSDG